MKGLTGKGDRFVVFKDGSLWYWNLIVSNSPSAVPVAKSGKGYPSKNAALKALQSARSAAGHNQTILLWRARSAGAQAGTYKPRPAWQRPNNSFKPNALQLHRPHGRLSLPCGRLRYARRLNSGVRAQDEIYCGLVFYRTRGCTGSFLFLSGVGGLWLDFAPTVGVEAIGLHVSAVTCSFSRVCLSCSLRLHSAARLSVPPQSWQSHRL